MLLDNLWAVLKGYWKAAEKCPSGIDIHRANAHIGRG
jgi:hypothetical protein